MKVLEGIFQGWYTDTYPCYTRTFTVRNPGPGPHTETITSVMSHVAQQLEQIDPGTRIRVTVEVVQ